MTQIINDDVINWAKDYDGPLFHALICDPPYYLDTVVKRFKNVDENTDGIVAERIRNRSDGLARLASGFLGQEWDTDIALNPKTWEILGNLLYPGAIGMSYSHARTYHQIATAIEEAGFIIYPMIGWINCLSDDTEVLTDSGFKLITDLEEQDKVAVWDSETEDIEFEVPKSRVFYRHKGQMVRIKNSYVDQLVTPNHRVYMKEWDRQTIDGKRVGHWSQWRWKHASDIGKRNIKLPLSGIHKPVDNNLNSKKINYARLLGYIWTEGHFTKENNSISIYQSSVNPVTVQNIRNTLYNISKFYDIKISEITRERTYKDRDYIEYRFYISGNITKNIRKDLPNKKLNYDLIFRMSEYEKRAFYHTAMEGDGSYTNQFYQKDCMEEFQVLCHLIGKRGKPGKNIDLSIADVTDCTVNPYKHVHTENYDGNVWCLRVSTGAFVIRRNGKISITGNSQGFPHPTKLKEYEGYYYNRNALKGALEPICVFQKRYEGTMKENILETGAGVFWIDGSRIPSEPIPINRLENWSGFGEHKRPNYTPTVNTEGRWPANVVVDEGIGEPYENFFFVSKPNKEERGENPHPTIKPIDLNRHLASMILPPENFKPRRLLNPFMGSGSEMIGAILAGWDDVVGVEIDEKYCEVAEDRVEYWTDEKQK